ncbi:glycerol acyltransferase [Rhodobacteraceae bacterium RKSG542]|uniref:lysophospholipid acyltransferase family protein n=1 Tax=Pseudovibrio flavus TaxID=2529854 RepID=UPI0012BBC1FD|nr:lysophospholipid acyltransferase family protein [Pseudovibrio flavus]MTI19371.1 glycerol acyltransferase [Pseudovibrio flavus]
MKFAQLTYAGSVQSGFKRRTIGALERVTGRDRMVSVYNDWKQNSFGKKHLVWNDLLKALSLNLDISGANWERSEVTGQPRVLIANHPYGLADGVAVLALAEKLGRPFRILINDQLLKVPEVRPYALPVQFSRSEEAVKHNAWMKEEAHRLLREGTTIIIFPGGGVATAKQPFGVAQELPWRTFAAQLARSEGACVLPVRFHGQNSWVFQAASKLSMTFRLALLVWEFRRSMGRTMKVSLGEPITPDACARYGNDKALTEFVKKRVLELR